MAPPTRSGSGQRSRVSAGASTRGAARSAVATNASPFDTTPPPVDPAALAAAAERDRRAQEAAALVSASPSARSSCAAQAFIESAITLRSDIEAGRSVFMLPTVQRDFVWSTAQQVRFLSRMARSTPTTAMLVQRVEPVPSWAGEARACWLVLDGQQRLRTMGLPLVDAQGRPVTLPPPLYLDLAAWLRSSTEECWREAPVTERPITVSDITSGRFRRVLDRLYPREGEHEVMDWELYVEMDAASAVEERMGRMPIPFVVVNPPRDEGADHAEFMRLLFEAWNSGGTPISAETLAQLMAR